jgi:hypothetical protein
MNGDLRSQPGFHSRGRFEFMGPLSAGSRSIHSFRVPKAFSHEKTLAVSL